MSDRGSSGRSGAGQLKAIVAAMLRPGAALRAATARAEVAEARLRAVVDAMPEGIVLLDAEGRYVLWNERYSQIYHRSADMFAPGAKLMDTLRVGVARGDYPEAVGREEAWLAERERWLSDPGQRHEQQISDGRWLLIEERRTADGGIIGLRVDITDMKRQAQALERAVAQAEAANVAKSEFLANMSHEIRTPLHGVLGMAQVMARDALSPEQGARLGVIRRSGDALLGLLNDLLDLSKIEAGKLDLNPAPFDLESVVIGACGPFEGLAQEKGVRLEVAVAPDARGGWLGDGPRLQQVLANLVSNAVKFTDEGQVSVTLEAVDGDLRARVSDTGIGIPQDRLSVLFQKFSQVESSTSRRFAGTGLGLSISRQLVQMMGGDLTVTSRFGGGSTFTVTAPLTRASVPAAEPAAAFGLGRRSPGDRRPRVLAAEDNLTNQLILQALLEPLDLELVMAANGEEAVAAFAARPFDLVLMDIQMPEVDGLAATRRIRAAELAQGAERTPIVALSANVMTHQIADYLAAGMDDVVPKPVEAERLFAAVIGALSRAPAAA
jgi:signal transduction histidine kinase/ActR/RegA family two-component response regulator